MTEKCEQMSPRVRILTSLDHREPDRVPFDLGGHPDAGIHIVAYRGLRRQLGFDTSAEISDLITQQAVVDDSMREKLGIDVRRVDCSIYLEHAIFEEQEKYSTFRDEYGIRWAKPKDGGLYYDMIGHPLSGEITTTDVARLELPPVVDLARMESLRAEAKRIHDAGYAVLVSAPGGGLFELATWLRGFEDVFIDIGTGSTVLEALLDRLLEHRIGYWRAVLDSLGEYVDVVNEADDVATQQTLMFDPRVFRKVLKPRYAALFGEMRKRVNKRLFISFHSCGAITEILPDLIEAGIDAINPVQVSARGMDTKELKRTFGRDVTFWGGGVDTQRVLAAGTKDEVREEVLRRIGDLSPGGGFIFAAVRNIQADVPPENIVTMWETLKKYGNY